MTSAATHVITLLCTDRAEILWPCVHLLKKPQTPRLSGWNSVLLGYQTDSQGAASKSYGDWDGLSQSRRNSLTVICMKKWELWVVHTVLMFALHHVLCHEIHHPLDIETYRTDWSENHPSWQVFISENKSSYSMWPPRTINWNISFFCSASLPFCGIRVGSTLAVWGCKVYWHS